MDSTDPAKSSNSAETDALRSLQSDADAQRSSSLSPEIKIGEQSPLASPFVAPPPPPPLRHQTLPNISTRQSISVSPFHQHSLPNPSASTSHGPPNGSQGPSTTLSRTVSAHVDAAPLPPPPSPNPANSGHSRSPSTTSSPNSGQHGVPYLKSLADRSGAYTSSAAYPVQYPQHIQHTAIHSNSLPVNYYAPHFTHTYSAMHGRPHPQAQIFQPGSYQSFYPSPPPVPSRMGSLPSTVYKSASPSPILPSSVSSPGPSPPPRPPKPPELHYNVDSSTTYLTPTTPTSSPPSVPVLEIHESLPRHRQPRGQQMDDSSAGTYFHDRALGANTANGLGQPIPVSGPRSSHHSERSLEIYFTPPEGILRAQLSERRLGVERGDDAIEERTGHASTTSIRNENDRRNGGLPPEVPTRPESHPQDQPLADEVGPGETPLTENASIDTANDPPSSNSAPGAAEEAPPPTYEQVLLEPLHAALISPIPRPHSDFSPSRRGNRLPQPPQSPPPGFNEPVFESLDHLFNPVSSSPSGPSSDAHISNHTASTASHQQSDPEPDAPSENRDSHPTIFTSPPTPSPLHSRSNSRASPTAFRSPALPRRFTLSSVDSPPKSPSSEPEDPFSDPAAFQTSSSPFAAVSTSEAATSPSSMPRNDSFSRKELDSRPQFESHRSFSGIWSKTSAPSTPKDEFGSEELYRQSMDLAKQQSNSKGKQRAESGSRLSTFFRPSSSHGKPATPSQEPSSPALDTARAGSVDLLGDLPSEASWMNEGSVGESGLTDPPLPVEDEQSANLVPSNLWDGIEFGFRNPHWDAVPTEGSYSDPSKWPECIALYPLGSEPFFIRAPSWRALLRFLASQSTTRIEPSVEALAVSRTPTIDLRLVVQFVRTQYTPKNTTRDVCLYFTLHCEMPAADTKQGRNISTTDRNAMESWDTRVLPYGFICGQHSLLKNPKVRPSPHNEPLGLRGTPMRDQDPDGEDSIFVTLPPPFVELPVKLSDIALYLHECLVLSRNHGKIRRNKEAGKNSLEPPVSKLRRGRGSSTNLPEEVEPKWGPSTPAESDQSHAFPSNTVATNIPGINRLAKAIRSIYPNEYGLGSTKPDPANSTGHLQPQKVTNVNDHNKPGGARKGGILGAFQRMRSKSSMAKNTVGTLAAGSGPPRRDMNTERFELVTPWRQTAE